MNEDKGKSVSVEVFYQENKTNLKMKLASQKGDFNKSIVDQNLHRPGLALTGFFQEFPARRIQVCGNTEMAYLQQLPRQDHAAILKKMMAFDIPCFVITDGKKPSPEFLQLADERGLCVFTTSLDATKAIQEIRSYLEEKFAPRTMIHGTLVDVYGIGILITGRSAIGKSEVALDLVARGHRLIADDAIAVIRKGEGVLVGQVDGGLGYHMEIRGVGIVDVQSVFGIQSVRKKKRIDVQVELMDWDNSQGYERTGLEERTVEILGEKIPLIQLPVYPGKNISVIMEVIALNQLLKVYGYHAARRFDGKLKRSMKAKLQAVKASLYRDFD